VKITFANYKLERSANNDRVLKREFGKIRAEKIQIRLAQLRFATSLEDVRHMPGNYHELLHNRKGQWACDLDQPYRLIFKPHNLPIPTYQNGNYCWSEIFGIEIIEIVNYHNKD